MIGKEWEEEFEDDIMIDDESYAQGTLIYLSNSLFENKNHPDLTPKLEDIFIKYLGKGRLKFQCCNGEIRIKKI